MQNSRVGLLSVNAVVHVSKIRRRAATGLGHHAKLVTARINLERIDRAVLDGLVTNRDMHGHAHDRRQRSQSSGVTSDPDSTTITYLPINITTHLDIGFSIHGTHRRTVAQRRPSAKETPPLAHNKGQRLPLKTPVLI